jgi:hypothetical protein
MAMTLPPTEDESSALRRRAISKYVESRSRAELLDRVLDEELPRYAEAMNLLGQQSARPTRG